MIDISHKLLPWLLPWEFSPTVLLTVGGAAVLFARGAAREARAGRRMFWLRQWSFYFGLALIYVPLQTRFDYLAQHMFWIHRLQHLLLHHLGPFFVALSAPWTAIAAGAPAAVRAPARMLWYGTPIRSVYAFLQRPLVAFALFIGLIAFWLWPSVHFDAMLNATDYRLMNWSMALDGLLFWWLLFDPRSREQGAQIGFGARIPIIVLAIPPQILIGAYLCLHHGIVYDVYAVCGRLWPIDPVMDQQIGGLITWIPASMMSVIATLILIKRSMYYDNFRRQAAQARAVEA